MILLEYYLWPISEPHNFLQDNATNDLTLWCAFCNSRIKMPKTKELSRYMWDRIIERHKGAPGYRKISKEMNITLSKIGNVIKKYKKYGDGTANLPRNGRPREINESASR